MTSLAQLAQGAGLQLLDAKVSIPNFELPVLTGEIVDTPRQFESLFCDNTFGRPADLTAIYVTLPECENCRPGLEALDKLQRSLLTEAGQSQAAVKPKVCLRAVISDWPTPAEVSQEFSRSGVSAMKGIVWDPRGVLSERLAIVAQPSFYLLDREGGLLAYQNGPVEFSSPGFEVFWQRLIQEMNSSEFQAQDLRLGAIFNAERNDLSSQSVSFLNKGILPWVWLVVVGLLCYTLVRFFLRLRKNFTGPQN